MKQQAFIIHGGDTFNTHEEYLAFLHDKEISIENTGYRDWKSFLQEDLGGDYQTITPRMPCKENSKYSEWKLWFEKFIPLLQDGVILIGHSLGGIFLAKYLSEENFPRKITATFLVAAPYSDESMYQLGTFKITNPLKKLELQGGGIYIYQSKDDPVVRFSEGEKYQKALPAAILRSFENQGHFNSTKLPQLVADIQNLSKA